MGLALLLVGAPVGASLGDLNCSTPLSDTVKPVSFFSCGGTPCHAQNPQGRSPGRQPPPAPGSGKGRRSSLRRAQAASRRAQTRGTGRGPAHAARPHPGSPTTGRRPLAAPRPGRRRRAPTLQLTLEPNQLVQRGRDRADVAMVVTRSGRRPRRRRRRPRRTLAARRTEGGSHRLVQRLVGRVLAFRHGDGLERVAVGAPHGPCGFQGDVPVPGRPVALGRLPTAGRPRPGGRGRDVRHARPAVGGAPASRPRSPGT